MKKLLSAIFILLSVGCVRETLDPLERVDAQVAAYGKIDAHFCTAAPAPAQQEIKYLIVMDHSSSNQSGIPSSAGDITGTDPNGARRYGALVQFVQNLAVIPQVTTSFALIDFGDNATLPQSQTGFSSQTDFITTLTTDWRGSGTNTNQIPNDAGFTNYQDALTETISVIHDDAQLQVVSQNPVRSTYIVIFVSDGIPTVSDGAGGTLVQSTSSLVQKVTDLLALKNAADVGSQIASITMNTSYYSLDTTDPTAQAQQTAARNLLQTLATTGNGQFSQAATGQNLLYQQFVPPATVLQHDFADLFVENKNAVWWDDGSLMQDTDGDGLPDRIEAQLGSDPTRVDSDGNGVSDLVEYRTQGKPCADAQCSSASRFPYSVCAGYSPVTDASGNVSFAITSNDGLNDCEKYLLQGDPDVFNSNGDLIPDFLAFKNTLAISSTSAPAAFADPFGDGLSNVDKIKAGLPIQVSTKAMSHYQQRTSRIVEESSPSPDISCYHFTMDHVAMTAMDNRVRVTIVQNVSGVENKPFSVIAEKSFSADATTLYFVPGDFQ